MKTTKSVTQSGFRKPPELETIIRNTSFFLIHLKLVHFSCTSGTLCVNYTSNKQTPFFFISLLYLFLHLLLPSLFCFFMNMITEDGNSVIPDRCIPFTSLDPIILSQSQTQIPGKENFVSQLQSGPVELYHIKCLPGTHHSK